MKKASVLFCVFLVLLCGCRQNGEQAEKQQMELQTGSPATPTPVGEAGVTEVPKITEIVEVTPAEISSEIPEEAAPSEMPEPTETPIPTETPLPTETPVPADTTAPVIEGVCDKTVYVGETISYKKGVTVTDNSDGAVQLDIDSSEVDLDTVGQYAVTYTATDEAGNVTVEQITVTVIEMDEKEAEVNRLADELIAELITEDMSKWDTCYKLWNWCRTKIKYSYSAGDRSSIYAGAYEGLHDRAGDCYAYYATFTVLLQKCGIETMEVRRVGGDSDHWWNLVNLGDGWYHCDSSPRKVGHTYKCFMQTDAQIQAYTDYYTEKPEYYTFDKSLYPERETTIVYDGKIN